MFRAAFTSRSWAVPQSTQLSDGAVAGFVAKVPGRVDLARHLTQHFGVPVFDTQLEGLGVVHAIKYSLVFETIARGIHGQATHNG